MNQNKSSSESAETPEPTESAETPESTESAESTDSSESAASPLLFDSFESADSPAPADSADSIAPADSVDSRGTADSVDSDDAFDSSDPGASASTEPTESAETPESTESAESAEPSESADSPTPTDSSTPADSIDSPESDESDEFAPPVSLAWDRLEGVPDPIEHSALFGHDDAIDSLARHYAGGRMHHAWLICGPRGVGKATLACRFAWHVLSHCDPASAPQRYQRPEKADPLARRIAGGGHANLLMLRRPWDSQAGKFRSAIGVDEVRKVHRFLANSAGENGWRIIIVDAADDLNRNSSNALLKILEEPPPRTVFLMLSRAPGKLLPTIRSRCQKLVLRALEPESLFAALEAVGVRKTQAESTESAESGRGGGVERIAELGDLAGGSARQAILLLAHEGLALRERFLELTSDPERFDWVGVHQFCDGLSRSGGEEKYRLFLELFGDLLERSVRAKAEAIPSAEGQAGAGEAEMNLSALARGVEVWEKARRRADLADEWQLDRKQTMLDLFASLKQSGFSVSVRSRSA